MTLSKTTLLVALSEGFARPKLFAAKLDKLIGNLDVTDTVVLQDARGFAQSYFSEKDISTTVAVGLSRAKIKKLVSDCTHVVVFWGGEDLHDVVYFAKLLKKQLRVFAVPITTVRNRKNEEFDIYIGRGSRWGNPFEISRGPNGIGREEVIEKFKSYFEEQILANPDQHSLLLSLRGYRLGCYCKPEKCHGDVIAEYLNAYGDVAGEAADASDDS